MHIYLIRHAQAVPDSFERTDEARWLTRIGRESAVRLGQRLKEQGIEFDAVVASPLVRAVQTAELLIGTMNGDPSKREVGILEALRPSGDPGRAVEEISTLGASVAVVSHEPILSTIAALSTGERLMPGFDKGEAILIEDGVLRWRLGSGGN